jgi:hypothetical protein
LTVSIDSVIKSGVRIFAPTETSALLVTNRGPSIGHFAMHITEPAQWDDWNQLEAALHTGEVAFERANGKSVYDFCQDDPWSGDVFMNAMSFLTDHAVNALLDVYDFDRFPTIMDDRLDEFIAYGWYHRLHTLGVSPALRASWHNPDRFRLYSSESQQSFIT